MASSILDLLLPVDDRDCSFVLELPAEADCRAAPATAADATADDSGAADEPATKRQRVEGRPDAAEKCAGKSCPCIDQPGEALVGCLIDGELWPHSVPGLNPHSKCCLLSAVQAAQTSRLRPRCLAEPARREVLPACSIVLRQFSCKLRQEKTDCTTRWAGQCPMFLML